VFEFELLWLAPYSGRWPLRNFRAHSVALLWRKPTPEHLPGQWPKISAVKSEKTAEDGPGIIRGFGWEAGTGEEWVVIGWKKGPRVALTARDFLGVRDAGLLKGDGLPTAAFLHVDSGEHHFAVGIFPPKVPLTSVLPVIIAVSPYTRTFISESSLDVSLVWPVLNAFTICDLSDIRPYKLMNV
jgi:hypothetical protein